MFRMIQLQKEILFFSIECKDGCSICKKNFGKSNYFSYQKLILTTTKYKIEFKLMVSVLNVLPYVKFVNKDQYEEIKQINPYFFLTSEILFILIYVNKNPLPRVTINQYSQFAYYCINDDCSQLFKYQVNKSCEGYSSVYNFNDIQHYQYFNSIGLKDRNYFKLAFRSYLSDNEQLKFLNCKLFQRKSVYVISQIENQGYQFNDYRHQLLFKLINTNKIINLRRDFINFLFIQYSYFDMNIQNSLIFFRLQSQDLRESIKQIICKLNNTSLLFFSYLSRKIIIDNLIIKSCQFYTSQVIQSNISLNNFAYIYYYQQCRYSELLFFRVKIYIQLWKF